MFAILQSASLAPIFVCTPGDDHTGRPEATNLFMSASNLACTPVWKSNLQPDFNVRVMDGFDARLSAVLRELDESNRFVQKSAESTSISSS